MKYINSEKLIAEIDRQKIGYNTDGKHTAEYDTCIKILDIIASLQQEQPNGKQVIIITETDGDANIHWDCRSLDDVEALLKSAESFITEKQIEKMAGPGSGPDYATTEGRYSHLFKCQQEQQEVDLEKEIKNYLATKCAGDDEPSVSEIARHFYELGSNARKED